MLKKLTLTAAALLVAGALIVRLERVQAQTGPCVPPTLFATTCAPIKVQVPICSYELAPFINPNLGYNYWHGMPVSFGGPVYFYTAPRSIGYYYGFGPNLPLLLAVEQNMVTEVTILPNSGQCQAPAPAYVAPTPVPTPAPTIVYRAVEVAKPTTFSDVKAGIAQLRPPSTGSAGLKTSEE